MRARFPAGGPAVAVVAILATGTNVGCSLLAVDGPRPAWERRGAPLACETSVTLPLLDMVAATGFLANYAVGTSVDYADYALGGRPRPLVALLELGAFAVLTTSAVVGYVRVRRCRRAFKDLTVRGDEDVPTSVLTFPASPVTTSTTGVPRLRVPFSTAVFPPWLPSS